MARDTLLGFPAHTLPFRCEKFTTLSVVSAARSFRAAFLLIFSVFIKPVFVNGRFSEGSRHAAAAFFGRLRCQIMPMAKPMTAGSSQPRFLSNSGRLAVAN